jgi:hypothetical protein
MQHAIIDIFISLGFNIIFRPYRRPPVGQTPAEEKTMKRLSLAALGILTTTLAFAQTTPPPQLASQTTASGSANVRFTREQLQAIMPPLAAHFDEIDTTHQGYVTPEQVQQYVSKHPPQIPTPPQLPSPPVSAQMMPPPLPQ